MYNYINFKKYLKNILSDIDEDEALDILSSRSPVTSLSIFEDQYLFHDCILKFSQCLGLENFYGKLKNSNEIIEIFFSSCNNCLDYDSRQEMILYGIEKIVEEFLDNPALIEEFSCWIGEIVFEMYDQRPAEDQNSSDCDYPDYS